MYYVQIKYFHNAAHSSGYHSFCKLIVAHEEFIETESFWYWSVRGHGSELDTHDAGAVKLCVGYIDNSVFPILIAVMPF